MTEPRYYCVTIRLDTTLPDDLYADASLAPGTVIDVGDSATGLGLVGRIVAIHLHAEGREEKAP